ncbi:hypothetical protein [Humibacter ginsenosidimutans]|uniref:DUF559 domain-containing protein n=1 Tax=Humibacter ginsenosidimutans TaxID=2599293 RepID=A0A5B8M4F2_9MICO|nr:hypothetical protein [Humibacter ginsenosidimutans]QDZ14824.1 hypothetical protein FPZ11_08690 [Humibacter ginsenosidimutans]
MSRTAAALPGDLGDGFAVRAAREAGVAAKRLRALDLESPFFGVRTRRSEADRRSPQSAPVRDSRADETRRLADLIARRAKAFAAIAAPDSCFCHATAAVMWGLPLPLRVLRRVAAATERNGESVAPRGIDVGVLAPARPSRAAGVKGRQLSARLIDVRESNGLRLTNPATTWAMLADELAVDELIELGDAIVFIPRRRGMLRGTSEDALGTPAELRAAANTPYRRHSDRLRSAVDEIRIGAASPAETRYRIASIRAGLPLPELDFDVFTATGAPIGFTEIAYPDYRVLVEYEGDHHRIDRDQWNRDIEKHSACADAGWRVIRLTARHLYPSTAPAVAQVRTALLRAGWRPSS